MLQEKQRTAADISPTVNNMADIFKVPQGGVFLMQKHLTNDMDVRRSRPEEYGVLVTRKP